MEVLLNYEFAKHLLVFTAYYLLIIFSIGWYVYLILEFFRLTFRLFKKWIKKMKQRKHKEDESNE